MDSSFQRIETMMGTGIDIDVRRAHCTQAELESVIDKTFVRLSQIEQMFSTYISSSEISRLGRGEIELSDCSGDVKEIVDLCDKLNALTNGYFDAYLAAKTEPTLSIQKSNQAGAKPIEPSGVVKGWAVDQAAQMLQRGSATDFCVYAGGDMVVMGEQSVGTRWQIGLQHPKLTDSIMAVLSVKDVAIATSGLYARGDHIVRPDGTGEELISVSVIGSDVVLADAYATAVFAMGKPGLNWIINQPGFYVYAVGADNQAYFSEELSKVLV